MQINKNLTSLTLVASLFTDPSIASKYIGFPPGPYLVIVLIMVLYQIIFLLKRRSFCLHKKIIFLVTFFTIYAVSSLSYRVLVSQSVGDLGLHVLMIINFYFLLLVMTDYKWQDSLVTAIYVAGIFHLFSLLPDPVGFRTNLISSTAYGLGEGGLSELFRRETGLFPAPAMLVIFSLILFEVAFFKYSVSESIFFPIFFAGIAITLGLSTFNRSFLVGIIFALLVLNWCIGLRRRLLILYAIGVSILLMLPLGAYTEFVGYRFYELLDSGIEASQRWTGDTGIITGFDIFMSHPFFGNPIAPLGGTLQALDAQTKVVNPHNGWVQILAIYGLIGGAPLLFLYVWSTIRAIKILIIHRTYLAQKKVFRNLAQLQILFSVISVTLAVILMAEPLGEYSFVLLLSLTPVIASLPRFSVRY